MTPEIRVVSCTRSTNADLRELAEQGAAHGTAVRAREQTAGRGRLGRVWVTAPDEALLMSVLIRRPIDASRVPLLALTTAVAVSDAVDGLQIKWPNDLLCPVGRKVSGILCEAEFLHGRLDFAVIGIGLNVHGHPNISGSTCLGDAFPDSTWSVPILAERVRRCVLQRVRELHGDVQPVLADWRSRAHTLGRLVSVAGLRGRAVDIDDDGALLIETGGGIRRVLAGDVNLA